VFDFAKIRAWQRFPTLQTKTWLRRVHINKALTFYTRDSEKHSKNCDSKSNNKDLQWLAADSVADNREIGKTKLNVNNYMQLTTLMNRVWKANQIAQKTFEKSFVFDYASNESLVF